MLLEALILASEKAANIARKCRENEHLFQLLIEEKSENEANPRFVKDFKTLADVLIQETLKHDIGNKYPAIKANIKGEESNVFCNAIGESICVEILDTCEETADLLAKVLNGDLQAAHLLAEEVHQQLTLNDVQTEWPKTDINRDDFSQLGIWIDPIDSTAEYINGSAEEANNETNTGVSASGLQCVTVLIGVYDLSNGDVIMGIVNQPFYKYSNNSWHGICYWGFNDGNVVGNSLGNISYPRTNIICLSSSESPIIKQKLKSAGFKLIEAAGAGYKMLATIIGFSDAYLLTKSSTFKWDTCGPHGILKSLKGDVIIYDKAVTNNSIISVNYKIDDEVSNKIERCCNVGGIIVYRDTDILKEIVGLLSVI